MTLCLITFGCGAKKSKSKETEKETTPVTQGIEPAKPVAVEGPVSIPDLEMDNLDVSSMNAIELVAAMKTGWNLGNTFDATAAHASGLATETCWGQPKTTKEMIDGLKAAGFRTIRIPISWNQHVSSDGKYTIDEAWMNRVKEVVDWAYNQKMFVIINSHHDCWETNTPISEGKGFYYPSNENKDASCAYLKSIWTQIATVFADYDNHLIFETMNEPRLRGTNNEWWYDANSDLCKEARDVLYELNKTTLAAIRSVKGNEKRLVMIPALQASPDSAFADGFKLPSDKSNMIALSVHMYTPYNFAMASPGDISFTGVHKADLTRHFNKLNELFVSKGIPVVIGEYGATNKDNLQDREEWFSFFVAGAKKYGMPCCVWDNGVWEIKGSAANRFEEHYGYYNRKKQTWYFPTLVEKIMESCN